MKTNHRFSVVCLKLNTYNDYHEKQQYQFELNMLCSLQIYYPCKHLNGMLHYITSWDTPSNYIYSSKVATYVDIWCATTYDSINNDKTMTIDTDGRKHVRILCIQQSQERRIVGVFNIYSMKDKLAIIAFVKTSCEIWVNLY